MPHPSISLFFHPAIEDKALPNPMKENKTASPQQNAKK